MYAWVFLKEVGKLFSCALRRILFLPNFVTYSLTFHIWASYVDFCGE